ncbi:MAG: hypothetical protein ACKO27_08000 [Ilumatobacteraceae bacterium]
MTATAALLGLSLDTAKNIALGLGISFLAMSVASAVLVKKIVTKLVMAVLLVALAVAMWSQRANLQDCAAKAKDRVAGSGQQVVCSFFGTDVAVD